MRKLYKSVFSILTLTAATAFVNNASAQFGCGSAVVLSNGYTQTGITTPGTGGAEDWNDNPTGTSITGSYWDDDVYLFEYTAVAATEQISMTIDTRNTYTGIGIFDDCTGTAFSTELDAVAMSSSTGTATVSATISSGNTIYIAVGQWGTPNDLDFDVTDFTVTAITCPDPSALMASNITATSADLGWTENGSATMWNVEYGMAGFTQGTGTMVTGTTSNPLALTGLSASSDYEFYVQADCGGGDESAWIGPFAFSTLCVSESIPWMEDFEGLSSVGTTVFPSCWSKENGDWQTSDNAGSSYDADALSGSYFLRNRYGATDEYIWTPGFDLTAGEYYDFTFWWAGDGYSGWDGDVFYNTDQTSVGATQIGTSFITSASATDQTYRQELYRFQAPTTGTFYFAIRVNANFSPWDLSFDDFGLDMTPACPDPTNLMTTWVDNDSVVLTWDAGFMESDWNVELGATGFTPGTGASIYAGSVSTTPTDTIGGLTQITDYDVYVQADCGGGDASAWVGPISFTSLPNCAAPSSLMATHINEDSVSVSWTAGGAETEWAIEYGPSGFTPGTGEGTVVSVSGMPNDTITGLGMSQMYDFYLVGLCSPTDSSLWVGPQSVLMPLGNDVACDAIELPVDGMNRFFYNNGASVTTDETTNLIIPSSSSSDGDDGWYWDTNITTSVWFKFTAPASGNVEINSNANGYWGQSAVFDIVDCADMTTATFIAGNDDDPLGVSYAPNVTVCGLTPGNEYYVLYDEEDGWGYGEIAMKLTEIAPNAGTDAQMDICSSDTVELYAIITDTDSSGVWSFDLNPNTIVNGDMFAANTVPTGVQSVSYIVEMGCAVDSSVAELTIYAPGNSGTAIDPYEACNSDVYLPNGLTGIVESGGTWADLSGTGLLTGSNNNVFAASSAPVGTYSFSYTVDNGVCPPSSTTLDVDVVDCTSIDENNTQLSMYPNPNNGSFFLVSETTDQSSVIITDVSGKIVYNNVLGLSAGTPIEVSLDNVESGMYFVNISNSNGTAVLNMIIK